MKKIILLTAILIPMLAVAQFNSDIIVYNPTGEPFQLYINNSLVNNYAAKKVVVPELQNGNYQLYVVFQNTSVQPISIVVTLPVNTLMTCQLQRSANGQYMIQSTNLVNYTVSSPNPYNPPYNPPTPPVNPYPPQMQGYCDMPMLATNFNTALATINNRSFDSDRLTLAKQIASSNCLTSSQVKQIIKTLSYESSKLDFAKYAYTHVYDPQNYYQINDAFSFSSSITELNEYIKSLK